MKSILCFTVCALSLLAFASTAQSKTAQANGTFDFDAGGATGSVVFDADGNDSGVTGQMTFNATVTIGTPDGDATTTVDVALQAVFDCLLVDDNEAAMSGTITSSNDPAYTVGQPVTLFVVDKVDGITPVVDAFAWGVYKPTVVNFNAADDERYPCFLPEDYPASPPICEVPDPGASLTWVTADAELYPCPQPTEENPTPSCPADPSGSTAGIPVTPTSVTCESFPLSAYPLTFIQRGHGNKIQVKHNP